MKVASMFAAAGLIVAGLVSSTAADAQNYRDRGYSESRSYRDNDRHDRYDGGNYRRDNGRHYGWRNGRGHRDRCHVEFRHHRRVTVCR